MKKKLIIKIHDIYTKNHITTQTKKDLLKPK